MKNLKKKRNTHETQLEFAIGNSHSEFLFVFYIYYITYAIQTPCVSVEPSLYRTLDKYY